MYTLIKLFVNKVSVNYLKRSILMMNDKYSIFFYVCRI